MKWLIGLGVVALLAMAAAFFVARGEHDAARPRLAPAAPVVHVTPGREFRDNLASGGQGPAMLDLPSGQFIQGSDPGEKGRDEQEGPAHAVTLAPFAIGKFEVTRGEFRRFVEATSYVTDAERNAPVKWNDVSDGCFAFGWKAGTSWRDAGIPQDDAHPVVCVSANDAAAYVEWLGRETGKPYRLPSESEFEYANRAGSTTAFPWGEDGEAGCADSNYADRRFASKFPDITTADCDDGHVFTSPAGSLRANGFGLHDLAGNVWERLGDCWNPNYEQAPTDGRAWNTGDCSERAMRGGSWGNTSPAWQRSAVRGHAPLSARTSDVGFRVARDPDAAADLPGPAAAGL